MGQEGKQLSEQDKDLQEREWIEDSTMQQSSDSYLLQNDESSIWQASVTTERLL